MSEAKGPVPFPKYYHMPNSTGASRCSRDCPACAHADGINAGRASRDGLRKALEKIAGEDYRGNRTVSASMAVAMMALEADGEVG